MPQEIEAGGEGRVLVPLTRGLHAVIDADDADRVLALKWQARPMRGSARGPGHYASGWLGSRPDRVKVYLHRFIMGAAHGQIVDHINGDALDCRKANLRIGTLTTNAINRLYDNPTGYRGVHRSGQKFKACLAVRHRTHTRYGFATAEAAGRAYDELARRHHGSAAVLNFPGDAR